MKFPDDSSDATREASTVFDLGNGNSFTLHTHAFLFTFQRPLGRNVKEEPHGNFTSSQTINTSTKTKLTGVKRAPALQPRKLSEKKKYECNEGKPKMKSNGLLKFVLPRKLTTGKATPVTS